jgi:hypothetical protein
MRNVIAAYEQGRQSFHNLVADLESLLKGLEGAPEWLDAFRHEWDGLVDIYKIAVDDNRPQPNSSDATVQATLAGMKRCLSSVEKLPCPCCGYLAFDEPPGSYDMCPVCDWEDDDLQLRFPDLAGGANRLSLIEAQQNFAQHGASDTRSLSRVRRPVAEDIRDPGWRPVDAQRDLFKTVARPDGTYEWPAEKSLLYYWRSDFWRRDVRE